MDIIHLHDIKVYAYHGCLNEERVIGNNYFVKISLEANLEQASISDQLQDTVDYVEVYQIVIDEMAIPSNLLEHIVRRIINRILNIKMVQSATVSVRKVSPPVGGVTSGVSIVMKRSKNLA